MTISFPPGYFDWILNIKCILGGEWAHRWLSADGIRNPFIAIACLWKQEVTIGKYRISTDLPVAWILYNFRYWINHTVSCFMLLDSEKRWQETDWDFSTNLKTRLLIYSMCYICIILVAILIWPPQIYSGVANMLEKV
jgi:hypothetical protein